MAIWGDDELAMAKLEDSTDDYPTPKLDRLMATPTNWSNDPMFEIRIEFEGGPTIHTQIKAAELAHYFAGLDMTEVLEYNVRKI